MPKPKEKWNFVDTKKRRNETEELKPKPKEHGFSWIRNGGNEASNGVVCPGPQVSMYEVWKRQQGHEDARKVYGAEVFVFLAEMEKASPGKSCFGKKSGQKSGDPDLVQKMLGLCEAKDGANIAELLQAQASGHRETWQDVKTNSGSRSWQGPCQGGKKLKN